ncbi:fumarylacetoacetate hydrolase family protein [Nakamurella sp. PAMC28650]|uniref:fumarylacetoacetate hydrolase family protein n=1 Tax=Nakamurella sp. PAMC28650 TaxID=2762325 RepID=UPI001C9A9C70|nr:fumarylacetoacetate hydrolase family protein [Nakamurella sp. PAMC28650]
MDPATPAFALGRLSDGTREFTALVRYERVLDLDTVADEIGLPVPVSVTDLLQDWTRVLPILENLSMTADLADHVVLAPVQPRQVFQSGANYRTHVIDLAMAHMEITEGKTVDEVRAEVAAMMDERAASGIPYVFLGLPSSIGGPFDDVTLPAYSDRHDWELELAAVIGVPAFRVGRGEALEHVAGYTIVNDLTTRDRVFRRDMKEIGTDWFRGKNAPGFLPTGPWLVPAAAVADPMDLRITLTLNGEVRQDESTKDMLFDVAALISEISQTTTLLPGDLVLTGSPAGNGQPTGRFLRDGDVMVGTITGLGSQVIRCVAEARR